MNMKIFPITVGIDLLITSILYIVCNGVNNWSEYSITGYSSTIGLWQVCATVYGASNCVKIECSSSSSSGDAASFCSKLMAARAFITLVCIALPLIGAAFILRTFFKDRFPNVTLIVLKIAVFVCFVFGVIGVAIGIAATIKPDESSSRAGISYKISAGGIIGIIAIILNLGGAISAIKVD